MNLIQRPVFYSILVMGCAYSMQEPSKLFLQKVQELGLTNASDINKFHEVAVGFGIDISQAEYSCSNNGEISLSQTRGEGFSKVKRLSDGTFDITTVEKWTSHAREGEYKARKQTYENVLVTLNMRKSAQEYKAKLVAQPEEKPFTLLEMQQRAMRLMSMSPEQRMAEALKNIPAADSFAPVRTSIQKPAAVSQPTPPSAGRVAEKDEGFIHQAFGPDAVQNNQKARELLQRDDVKKFIDAEIKKGAITKSWQELNAIAVFEADAPFKGAWKIHLGKGMSIMWLGGLSIESTDIQF